MSNEWNWHVNSLQSRLSELQNTIDSIKNCVEKRPGLDAATRAIGTIVESAAKSEKSLYEFPSAMAQILSDPAIGAILSGPAGEIVLYNSTAEEILGRDFMRHKDLKIRGVLEFSAHDKSARLGLDELPWTRAFRGETVPDMRMHVSRPAQTHDSWINASATPFRDPKGVVSGVVVFVIDTTEEVLLESNISNLCNNIHDQIAQVGSSHGQLRELADKLSNTGIQRILSESGPPSGGGDRDEDVRKKSQPRRDDSTETSSTRANQGGYFVGTAAGAEPVNRSGSSGQSIFNRAQETPAPQEAQAQTSEPPAAAPAWQPGSAQSQPAVDAPESVYGPAEGAAAVEEEVEDDLDDESEDQEGANTNEESVLEEEILDQEPVAQIESEHEPDLEGEPTSQVEDAAAAGAPTSSDFWIGGFDRTKSGEESQEDEPADVAEEIESSDEQNAEERPDTASDSPESLFGKLASLTRESEDGQAEPTSEPDSALPWPELVDGQDAGEPLWEEYTNNEEEVAPWEGETSEAKTLIGDEFDGLRKEQDLDELSGAYALPNLSAFAAQSASEPAEPEEVEFVAEEDVDVSLQVAPEYQEVAEVEELADEESAAGEPAEADYSEEDEVASGAYPAPYSSGDDTAGGVEPEAQPAYPEYAGQTYEPASEPVQPDYETESAAPLQEIAAQQEPQQEPQEVPAAVEADEEEIQDESVAKPTGMRGARDRKVRTSGSYTRLQPLSTTSELDEENFMEEGLTMESHVVRYNADDSEAEDELPGRVLVVDDIPVNQKLLLLHLKRLGYDADVANNGQEALDLLAQTEYGLILMDCDMPVMNGFEAATRIRSNEAYSHRRIPIIALTSYDRDGDKEKCIAAGMDDYITKGASQKELKETIERSIVSARQKSRTGVSIEAEEEDVQADIQPLDITSMLKLYGKEEVEEISKLFLSNMGTYIECMQLAIDKKDADSVAHFANAVKGPCAALGMRLMTRLTTDIMAYAESEDWTQVRVKYMRLKAVFVQTREELKKVCPDDSLLTK